VLDIRHAESEARLPRDPADWVRTDDAMLPTRWTWAARWDEGVTVELSMALDSGAPTCQLVQFRGTDLSPTLVRSVPLRDCITEAVEAARLSHPDRLRTVVRLWEDAPPVRARREGITPERLAEVAEHYRAAPDPRAPTRYVAEQMNVARSTAGHLVVEARRRGLLGPTQPRVAGETPKSKLTRRKKP